MRYSIAPNLPTPPEARAAGGSLAYLRNADGGGAIGLLHAVTSPLACELLLPWLAEEDRDAALGY
ncbi:MAG TPA: hypothetical protein VL961_09215, partial [Acidimicrobiales bacterium]|nr:hypothetical protein [Acidimicrobiales bacterium]